MSQLKKMRRKGKRGVYIKPLEEQKEVKKQSLITKIIKYIKSLWS